MVGRLLLASCGKKVGLEFMWDVTDQKLCCCGDTLISRDLLVYIYIYILCKAPNGSIPGADGKAWVPWPTTFGV